MRHLWKIVWKKRLTAVFRSGSIYLDRSCCRELGHSCWGYLNRSGRRNLDFSIWRDLNDMVVGPVVQYSSHLRTRPQPPGGPGWQPVPRPDLGSWRDLESSRRDRKSRGWSDIYH
ncbi:hypothetical protein DPMN_017741 [Dreissena polymorpha]|uniref:Uncharacterized protein n=2 Tax=Dreissena polymorpha TaxID=45954 RepID=A0A9D4S7R3_DREPO|nr:hypothetical protein DPMN_017741 [Dreissena polymorpha]